MFFRAEILEQMTERQLQLEIDLHDKRSSYVQRVRAILDKRIEARIRAAIVTDPTLSQWFAKDGE